MKGIGHLTWLVFGSLVGFAVPFIFSDLLSLPRDLYYLIYFAAIFAFLGLYARRTGLNVKDWFSRRLVWGLVLGLIFGALVARFILTTPATPKLSGAALAWALFWRGACYGAVDGLLMSVFPWTVTWRAFRAEEKPLGRKIAVGIVAWIFILVVTAAYHVGYRDYRSKALMKPVIGNTMNSLPTLLAANPAGAPLAHAIMHLAVVLHAPGSDVYLPPHGD